MKYIYFFISIISIYACNKTYVEGRIPVVTVENLNKSFKIVDKRVDLCTLRVDSAQFVLTLRSYYFKATIKDDYHNYSINDSVFAILISTPLPLQQKPKQNSVFKYQLGDFPIDSIQYVPNIDLFLSAGIKSPPYNLSYRKPSSIDSLNFSPKDDGYIAFNTLDSVNNRIYGWLHVIVDSSAVTFDRYGYQKYEAIKMGGEKN